MSRSKSWDILLLWALITVQTVELIALTILEQYLKITLGWSSSALLQLYCHRKFCVSVSQLHPRVHCSLCDTPKSNSHLPVLSDAAVFMLLRRQNNLMGSSRWHRSLGGLKPEHCHNNIHTWNPCMSSWFFSFLRIWWMCCCQCWNPSSHVDSKSD